MRTSLDFKIKKEVCQTESYFTLTCRMQTVCVSSYGNLLTYQGIMLNWSIFAISIPILDRVS